MYVILFGEEDSEEVYEKMLNISAHQEHFQLKTKSKLVSTLALSTGNMPRVRKEAHTLLKKIISAFERQCGNTHFEWNVDVLIPKFIFWESGWLRKKCNSIQ